MVVKVYISGISGNKEVKKRQQRVLMILDSKNVEYEIIDITEPGKEDDKEFMQTNSKATSDSKYPLPPQIFNDDDYCGDYEKFDLANEIDELEQFLKTIGDDLLDDDNEKEKSQSNSHNKLNGNSASREVSTEKEVSNVVIDDETDDRQNSTADDLDNDNEENDDEDKSKSLDEDENDDVKKSEKKDKNIDKDKEQEE